MRRLLLSSALLALVAASAGGAESITQDGVIVAGERVRSTLLNSEEKVVRVAALAGTKLTLQATRLKRSGVEPSLALWAPDGQPVDLGKRVRSTRRFARLRNFDVQETGVWNVAVRAESGGGGFELTTRTNARRRVVAPGELSNDTDVGEHEFDALPGSTLLLRTIPRGRPRWTPVATVRAPSGAVVPPVVTKRARGTRYLLPELGTYTVEVSGGPGKYKVIGSLRPLGPRSRTLEYTDVEALPEGDSVSPVSMPNDRKHVLTITGRGLSTVGQVTLFDGSGDVVGGVLQSQTATTIHALFDLTGLAPDVYTFRFITESARAVEAPLPITVTNHMPLIGGVDPPELPWGDTLSVTVEGSGFDDGATVTFRRNVDALDAPITVTGRTSHNDIDVDVTFPEYAVGPYDITVRDPNGVEKTLAKGFDVLGYRAEPVHSAAYQTGHFTTHYPRDAAYDTKNGTVLVGVQEGEQTVFRLFNATTLVEIDSVVASGGQGGGVLQRTPQVAWNPVDETWAMCWVHQTASIDYAVVMVVDADDLSVVHGEGFVGSEFIVSRVNIKPDFVNGGWVVVWQEYDGTASELLAMRFTTVGAIAVTDPITAAANEFGLIWDPVLEYMTDGHWVVAYGGASNLNASYAIRRVVLRALPSGLLTAGANEVMAQSSSWTDAWQPEMVRNPTDESVLLGFNYIEAGTAFRPAYMRLTPRLAQAGALNVLDGEGVFPQGLVDSMVWDPARDQFVVALTNTQTEVAVRRVQPDGRIVRTRELQAYEGIWGILFAGDLPGTLGLFRATDGVEDGITSGTLKSAIVGGLTR